jgi:hypothetical protein
LPIIGESLANESEKFIHILQHVFFAQGRQRLRDFLQRYFPAIDECAQAHGAEMAEHYGYAAIGFLGELDRLPDLGFVLPEVFGSLEIIREVDLPEDAGVRIGDVGARLDMEFLERNAHFFEYRGDIHARACGEAGHEHVAGLGSLVLPARFQGRIDDEAVVPGMDIESHSPSPIRASQQFRHLEFLPLDFRFP